MKYNQDIVLASNTEGWKQTQRQENNVSFRNGQDLPLVV